MGRLRKKARGKARVVRLFDRLTAHHERKIACPELVEGNDEAQHSIWAFYETVIIDGRPVRQ